MESPDDTIAQLGYAMLELSRPALFLADFFVGAYAAVPGCPLLTRGIRRYQSYFPSVKLITP
ncbi:MAG: hypothetical protein HY936_04815 [Nitrosomonadales bacterium]|nr:hypothetical protein [Nitrosomonadales bacterium]